jgi:hypothetical protein
LVCGTTITVAGTPETIEAGGLGTPLQATRNNDISRAVEPLEKRRVGMDNLSQFLGGFGRKHTK